MNKKMQYLIENSLKKKLKSKSFLVSNIVILLCFVLLCNIDTIIKAFGGNFGDDVKIYVVDDTNEVFEDYKKIIDNTYLSILETDNYVLTESDKKIEELKSEIKEDEKKDIIIHIVKDDKNVFKAEIMSYEYVDTIMYQNLVNSLNSLKYNVALARSNISLKELESIEKNVEVERIILNEDLDEEEELIKSISEVIVPLIILPFFILTVMIVNMVGAEINEEKTSKSMEVIISSVSPKIHFASKIISVNIFILIQIICLILCAIVGVGSRMLITGVPDVTTSLGSLTSSSSVNYVELFLNSEIFSGLIKSIPYIIVIYILSFVAYSLISGVLASMTTSIEDYNQLQTPLTLVMMVAYYIAIFSFMYESSLFIKIVSYIPFASAIVSPALIIMGEYSVVDMLITIGLLVITNYLLIKYGSRVYKVGILNYSSSNLWKKMWKSLKEK